MDNFMLDLDHHRITRGVIAAGAAVASVACFFGVKEALHAVFDVAGACFLSRNSSGFFSLRSSPAVPSERPHPAQDASNISKRRIKRKAKSPRVQGISNLGQTCYANVVLQAQSAVEEFVDFVHHSSNLSRVMRTTTGQKIANEDDRLLEKLDAVFLSLNGARKNGTSLFASVDDSGKQQLVNVEQLLMEVLDLLRMRIDEQADSHELILEMVQQIDRALDCYRRRASAFFNALILFTENPERTALLPIKTRCRRATLIRQSLLSRWNLCCDIGASQKSDSDDAVAENPITYADFFLYTALRSPFKGLAASQTTCLVCKENSPWLLECFDVMSLMLPPPSTSFNSPNFMENWSIPASTVVDINDSNSFSKHKSIATPTLPLFFPRLAPTPPPVTISQLLDQNFGSCLVHGVSCSTCTRRQRSKTDEAAVFDTKKRPVVDDDSDECSDANMLRTSKVKHTKLARIPACVCVHVNRTAWSGDAYKRNDRVVFPASINFSRWQLSHHVASAPRHEKTEDILQQVEIPLANETSELGKTINTASSNHEENSSRSTGECHLCSVIVHYGVANYGHYTTFRRAQSQRLSATKRLTEGENGKVSNAQLDQWVHCDDKSVISVSLNEHVLLANPYLLFYQRSQSSCGR